MPPITSPPRASRPPAPLRGDAPRRQLLQLAHAVSSNPTRKQLLEYLALRRLLRK